MRRADGQIVFITGASAGIGAALAREFARRGADVVLTARREDRLAALAGEIGKSGRRALSVLCDVTRPEDLRRAVTLTLEKFGKIDIVVANAGFGVRGNVEELDVEDYRRQFETNIFGVLHTFYATREALLASKGCFAVIGSVTGFVALPGAGAYAMSKHAVRALASSLGFEMKSRGVGVVYVAPGYVNTEFRQVDSSGQFHPEAPAHAWPWFVMPAERAAREIASGILRRSPVVVVTGHGKLAVFLVRHFPRTFRWLAGMFLARHPDGGRSLESASQRVAESESLRV
ncbi:MAG: SDR family NAD(P)-dependent oxidoreductase [Planctomycetota bacterium]